MNLTYADPPLRRVLLIDDEVGILKSLQRLLRRWEIETVATNHPLEALELVRSQDFSAVLCDHRMPEIEGAKLLGKIRDVCPDPMRIMLTGYADLQATVEAVNSGSIFRYLAKPWDELELRQALDLAISQFTLIRQNRRMSSLIAQQNIELRSWNAKLETKVAERTQSIRELNQQLEASFLGSVKIMGILADRAAVSLGGHSRRVAALSGEMAKTAGADAKEVLDVQIAAFLHDIGKVGLAENPADHSPGDHAARGADLIRSLPRLERAAEYVAGHHGDCLNRSNLPRASRWIAVCDAFDEILHPAQGPGAPSAKVALKELRRQVEDLKQHFEPSLLDLLESVLQKTGAFDREPTSAALDLLDLRPGMVLARALKSNQGQVLVGEDVRLDGDTIALILSRAEQKCVSEQALVYENTIY